MFESDNIIPAVALRGLNIFPGMVIHFDLSRKFSVNAVKTAMKCNGKLLAITQKDLDSETPGLSDLYKVGTVVNVRQITKLPQGVIRVLVEGLYRASLEDICMCEKKYLEARIVSIDEDDGRIGDDPIYEEASFRALLEILTGYMQYHPKVSRGISSQVSPDMPMNEIVNRITMNIPLPYDKKQEILEGQTTKERYDALSKILCDETAIAGIHADLSKEIKDKIDKNQREYIVREQIAMLRKELDGNKEITDEEFFHKQTDELVAGDDIKEKIHKEIKRFANIPDSGSEAAVQRAYIETLLELPWDKAESDNNDIGNASTVLDKNHYGMDNVKERIIEFLAVRNLNSKGHSPILCLVGPPGTGKTSIAKSMAEALNKKYVRICLGGVRDEAEIRGHRRTYVGAMPGRIVNGLKTAGVKNPLMLLDEIDKVSNDYKGDTFSALLEVLDPEENKQFRDHYTELPVDLSEVLFVATANDVSNIPRPLLDRMEVIEVSSYTENEKFHIAKEHLLKKQYEQNGMTGKMIRISDSAIKDVIRYYTREAGVRELERKIGQLCRKAAVKIVSDENIGKVSIGSKNLSEYLGKRKYLAISANEKDEIGIVRGLAWTAVGGDTLQIEVNMMPGKGEAKLTGRMGDVMKESAEIAMSYVRSVGPKYHLDEDVFTSNDFHIHIPEGAVPKDGPSAGITMATAILSAVTGIPVRCKVAMTGEITLRGKVLPIGGLKEKLLAARLAGIKKVLVPTQNEKDVEEISEEIIGDMQIVYVENMNEVLKHALTR